MQGIGAEGLRHEITGLQQMGDSRGGAMGMRLKKVDYEDDDDDDDDDNDEEDEKEEGEEGAV